MRLSSESLEGLAEGEVIRVGARLQRLRGGSVGGGCCGIKGGLSLPA